MKRITLIGALLGLLILPMGAEAKGFKWVELCGQDACSKTPGKDWNFQRRPLIFPPTMMSGRADRPPTAPAPWFRVTVAFAQANGRRANSVVAPDIRYAGGRDGSYGFVWEKLERKPLRTYLKLTDGIAPKPANTMPGGVGDPAVVLQSALRSTATAAAVL